MLLMVRKLIREENACSPVIELIHAWINGYIRLYSPKPRSHRDSCHQTAKSEVSKCFNPAESISSTRKYCRNSHPTRVFHLRSWAGESVSLPLQPPNASVSLRALNSSKVTGRRSTCKRSDSRLQRSCGSPVTATVTGLSSNFCPLSMRYRNVIT